MLKLNSVYLFALFAMVVILGVYTYFEIKNTYNDIGKVLETETTTLVHSISSALETSINSTNFFDELLLQKMLSFPILFQRRGNFDHPSIIDSSYVFLEFGINEFYLFNYHSPQGNYSNLLSNKFDKKRKSLKSKDGYIVSTNVNSALNTKLSNELLVQIVTNFEESTNWIELGNIISPYTNDEIYSVVRFLPEAQKYCLVGISTRILSEWRRKFSFGRVIREIAKMPDVAYFSLYDSLGVVASSGNVNQSADNLWKNELSKLTSEKFITRSLFIQNTEIREIVFKVETAPNEYLTAKLGISLENINHLKLKSTIRTLFSSLVFFALLLSVFYLFFFRQKFRKLFTKHAQYRFYVEQIFENSAEAIILFDENLKIILRNNYAERIFNLKDKNSYFDIFQDDTLQISSQAKVLQDSASGIQNVNPQEVDNFHKYLEIEYDTLEGKKILGCTIVYVKTNWENFYLLVAIDLTEIRKLQMQIAENEKFLALGTAGATFAHEIRNPLNSISMVAQRLELETNLPPDQLNMLRLIRKEIDRVNGIINQFIQLAKPEKISPKLISIADVITGTVNLIEDNLKEKNIRIITQIDSNPFVYADPDKLEQAFLNILLNSIDAIEKEGEIKIATRLIVKNLFNEMSADELTLTDNYSIGKGKESSWEKKDKSNSLNLLKWENFDHNQVGSENHRLQVLFEDNGCGIPQSYLSKVVEPFFTTKNKGLGIGLSIVNKIIQAHRGEMKIESIKDMGTKVTIELPIIN